MRHCFLCQSLTWSWHLVDGVAAPCCTLCRWLIRRGDLPGMIRELAAVAAALDKGGEE